MSFTLGQTAEERSPSFKRGLSGALEEGRQKGGELAAAAAQSGESFFHSVVHSAEGNLTLLTRALQAANAPADEWRASEAAPEGAKPETYSLDGRPPETAQQPAAPSGNASHLGKMLFSAGPKQLAVVAHIPKQLAEAKGVKVKDWVDAALKHVQGAKVVEAGDELVKAVAPLGENGDDAEKQMKEAIAAGVRYMRDKAAPLALKAP